ncbi:ABC transporter permease [Sediminispirochaeta bajacaliforniensis]|uniref:ABC transporter permease n=1 Tax=Sediminispirochaeta bajacaliforniensis TaxID=148 RepID=UPI0003788985|nr:ABC transporter permease subunit [Sediminispirochaeta bajacaliforniensis]
MALSVGKRIRRDRMLYLMFLFPALYFIIFHYIPIWGARLAFQKFNFFGSNRWVGLENFRILFSSPVFGRVFLNTVIISFMKLIFNFPAPIILALLLLEIRNGRFRKIVQSLVYLPHFLSWVVIAGIFISMLSLKDGLVNQLLERFGVAPVAFLTSHRHIRWVLVFSEMWRSVGWDSILYVAAILEIPEDLYDAAAIDGCGRFQKMTKITLPAIFPTMITVFILNLGFFMNAGFDQVFNLMNDSVISVVDIIDTYVYRVGLIQGEFSLGTAAGLFKGVIGLALIYGTHRTSKKLTGEGLW